MVVICVAIVVVSLGAGFVSVVLTVTILIVTSWGVCGWVLFVPVLLVIWVIVFALVIWVPNVCFIHFHFILELANIDLVDFVNLPFMNALFCDDVRLGVHCFLESCMEIFR